MKNLITNILMLFLLIFIAEGTASANEAVYVDTEFDYTNGWFDKNSDKFTINNEKAIDNDLNTYVSVGDKRPIVINFNENITLSLLSFYTAYANYQHNYKFYDESNNLLKNIRLNPASVESGTKYIEINLDGVKKIVVDGPTTNSTRIYELEIFERQPREMIKELKADSTHSTVTLKWNESKEKDYSGAVIKYDGAIVGKASKDDVSYTIKNLKINSNHKFSVAALYEDGTTSAYQDITINTKDAPPVIDLVAAEIKDTSTLLKWKNPNAKDITAINIYKDGELLKQLNKDSTSYLLNYLTPSTSYKYEVSLMFKDVESTKKTVSFKTKELADKKPPGDVTELQAKQEDKHVKLTYKFPLDEDFSHVNIYKNGLKLEEKVTDESYIDKSVSDNATYTYKVVAYDTSNNASGGVSVQITVVGSDVWDLKAQAKSYQEINLNWKNPKRNDVEHIAIYRKEKSESKSFISKLFSKSDGYTKLFETNGTEFKDFTVVADTEYSYKLTSFINGIESNGKTIKVKTPKTSVSGGGTEIDENGDYLIKWESPITGKIKVLIAGVEYKIVPAADKQIIIPKDKMKFDLLGMPDVQLIPIDDDGNEGLPSKPGGGGGNGGGMGDIIGGGDAADILNPDNVLDAGVALMGVVGAFLLLGLSFLVVPKLIRTIRVALEARKNAKFETSGRRINE